MIFVLGLNAIANGSIPTSIVSVTMLVEPSITETVSDMKLAT